MTQWVNGTLSLTTIRQMTPLSAFITSMEEDRAHDTDSQAALHLPSSFMDTALVNEALRAGSLDYPYAATDFRGLKP
jgi:hypothetical protein